MGLSDPKVDRANAKVVVHAILQQQTDYPEKICLTSAAELR